MTFKNTKLSTAVILLMLNMHATTYTDQKKTTPKKHLETKVTQKKQVAPKATEQNFPKEIDYAARLQLHEQHRIINDIHVSGNKLISKDSIKARLPLKIGDEFNVNFTASMIKNLYNTGYFHQVEIYGKPIGEHKIDLFVVVVEKTKLKDITFIGNKAASEKDLKAELKAEKMHTFSPAEIKAITSKIKKYYHKKNYHHVQVTGKIITESDDRVTAEFTITEGKKTYLNRILFKGNASIPSKKLKRVIFSKEDWILGMIDHSGVYHPEMTDGDKHMIEELYHNNGFVNAKVTEVKVETTPSDDYIITYFIHEGDRYRIKTIDIEGNEIVSEQRLKEIIPLYEGQMYSVENIRKSIENMRTMWGEHGYIFADINPSINPDDETKTVSLSFTSDLKDRVYLNRLSIRGNQKTKDKVIRRQILLDEGELITNRKMELSKACVGLLNYFDPKNGVNWKITRIDDTHADLDLMVNEVKTGHFQTNLSFGGSPKNRATPQTGLNFSCNVGDRNIGGSGIALAASTDISKKYRSFNASAVNPWLFDRPIRGSLNGFIKSSEYDDQINIAQDAPQERAVGGALGLGYVSKLLGGVLVDGTVGFEKITYEDKIESAKHLGAQDMAIAQLILNKNFQAGAQISFTGTVSQDKRNGIAFPTNGHQWNLSAQITIPGWDRCGKNSTHDCNVVPTALKPNFNYFKTELDVSWYTPLINEHDLILMLHANIGFVHPFKGKNIPWKQLYHVGGPTSIRGYLYGQVGPTWKQDSLGATKAFNVNIEFIVPLSSDLNTRGVIFYDGGAGWDTPYAQEFKEKAAQHNLSFDRDFYNNKFFYRHSVGIGVRMKSPTPLQVDFAIKLNPSKKFKNHLTEMHLSMDHSF